MRKGAPNGPRRYNLGTFVAPKLVLVEGPDEFQFIRFLQQREDVQIHVYEGKDQLKLEISTIKEIEGFAKIERGVIIRDADHDPSAALASVLSQWGDALETPVPKGIQPGNWFQDAMGREWCVWLMPDGQNPGDLETLLWRAVKPSDHVNCIDTLIRCLSDCSPIPIGAASKARLYSWLATHKQPFKELHEALSERSELFDPADVVFRDFARLLESL